MKKALIILVAIVLGLLGVVYFSSKPESPTTAPVKTSNNQAAEADSTAAINSELESVDLGDLDAEFKTIDSDLNSL